MASNQREQLTESVRGVIIEALQVASEQVTPDLAFGDLPQWDSMGHMEVMMSLEAQFDVEITPDTIANLTSIPAICNYINGQGNGRD
jgi:acyl carrier protein